VLTSRLATDVVEVDPADERARRALLERTSVREILMGAQDNLTNVLAVMLGVSIGSGRADLVALAGLSAAVAEAVSMGGVLYSSTRAEGALDARGRAETGDAPATRGSGLGPLQSGTVTFVAALLGGLVPLAPFAVLPLPAAVPASLAISVGALFLLGSAIGRVSGSIWWRDGLRLLLVAGLAALAAAVIGSNFAVA
jgi:VIT1/CCC1 family predicted Fe2+/Mn2+ transporter